MSHFSKVLVDVENTSALQYSGIDVGSLSEKVKTLFHSNGYRIEFEKDNLVIYEKGRYGLRLLLGTFYAYHKFKVAVSEIDETKCQVTIIKATSGMSGGEIGTKQAKAEFARINAFLKKL